MSDCAILVDRLSKLYRLGPKGAQGQFWRRVARASVDRLRGRSTAEVAKSHWALKDVSFTVRHGERIGIIGRNGAGKSTLLKIMSRVVYPTAGEVRIRGRLTSLLEVGTGFNDNLSGRENVFLNASLYGLTRPEIEQRFDDIVAFSEIRRFIDTPVKNYSSGMRMRLAFAVAAHLDPDILLLDEVLAVGDMSFQRKCLERVDDLTSGGRTLFLVSHSMDAIMRYCDRCVWLDQGKVQADGDVQAVVSEYVEAVLGARTSVSLESAAHPSEQKKEESAKRPAHSPLKQQPAPTSPAPLIPHVEEAAAASLESARVIEASGSVKTVFRVDEPVGVEMTYRIHESGLYVPAIHVYCPQGTFAFASVPPTSDPAEFRYHRSGRFCSLALIPPHLLNIGAYSVTLVVFSPDEAPFKRHFIAEQMLSFHVVEAEDAGASARGIMPRGFPGPVRPLLKWKVSSIAHAS
jgi:lipopolysaccharide transport system ATP-binding protein